MEHTKLKTLLKLTAVAAFSIVIILLLAEVSLRLVGYYPGYLVKKPPLKPGKKLVVYHDYITDEDGIMRVNPEINPAINQAIKSRRANEEAKTKKRYDYTIQEVIKDYAAISKNGNTFSRFIIGLKQKQPGELTEVEKAYLKYADNPINSDGFRSIAFENYKTDKVKILLLGDSHAWGLDAVPVTNSFADQLSGKGYVVFNTGIAATDPAQYLAIVKKFVPRLKPDIVLVNFCLANDPMHFWRVPQKDRPVCHITNAGWLEPYPYGCYLSPEESYKVVLKQITIQPVSLWDRVCSKSVLGTLLWKATGRHQRITHSRCDYDWNITVTDEYIDEIEKVSEQYGAKMILAIIPYRKDFPYTSRTKEQMIAEIRANFPGRKFFMPRDIKYEDYTEGGGHFNNVGMDKYTRFLVGVIDSVRNN